MLGFKKKNLVADALTVLFLISVFFFGGGSSVKAATLSNVDYATVVNDNTVIDSKYVFIPTFIPGKTTVKPFGTGWTTKYTKTGKTKYYSFVPTSDSQKGHQGVVYENVGMYQGKQIDLKITVNDWTYYTYTRGNISYSQQSIAHNEQGYSKVNQTWQFIDHESQEPVKVTGYMTINDIDDRQGIRFSQSTSQKIDDIYCTSSTWIQSNSNNGRYFFYEANGGLSEDADEFAMFTFTFSSASELEFDWERDYPGDPKWKPSKKVNTAIADKSGAAYFAFASYKLARTGLTKPEKFVNTAKTGLDLEKNQVMESYKDPIKYELIHVVNQELSKFYYKSYEIEDDIPDDLSIKSIKVYNQQDNDVTSYFDNKTKDNHVDLSAKSSILSDSKFYGTYYRVEIITNLPSLPRLYDMANNDVVTFKNTMKVTVDGKSDTSDPVVSKLYKRKITTHHIDNMSKKLITSNMEGKKFDGESYSYAPRYDLKYVYDDVIYDYTPVSKEKQEGVVKGKDVDLYFYYTHPNSDVALKKMQIYTDKASIGLPVKVNFSVKVLEYAEDWEKDEITVELYKKETDEKIASKRVKVGDLSKVMEFKVPPKYLNVDEVKNYEVRLAENDATKVVFTKGKSKIDTDGYTAAEKTLTADNRDANGEIKYKGVVMTEREIGQDMVRYYETFTINKIDQPRVKSGYGFIFTTKVEYTNDLLKDVLHEIGIQTNTDTVLSVDARLIDASLEYYHKGEAQANVKMDRQSEDLGDKSVKVAYELPQIYLEQESGLTYSPNQKNNGVIKGTPFDAGHKLYVPIWIRTLGKYDAVLKSQNPIGSNRIQFDVLNKVDVYAYMFSHTDSGTPDDDELLIKPMDQEAANSDLSTK